MAARSRSSTLADPANSVQLDPFTKVTEMIDEMLTALSKEQADAQAAYEATIIDTNASVQAHQESIVSETKVMGEAVKEHRNK
eukprot:16121808-Heterocapsa_arctica.AAC.1